MGRKMPPGKKDTAGEGAQCRAGTSATRAEEQIVAEGKC